MRAIKPTRAFHKDFRREINGIHGNKLQHLFPKITQLLANDEQLPEQFKDHTLKGAWEPHRECHLRPDLLLIYRKTNNNELTLVRLGSHSELF